MSSQSESGALVLPRSIEAGELTVRCWRDEDVDDMAAAVADNVEHLRPFLPWVSREPLSRDDRRTMIRTCEAERQHGGDVIYGIWRDGRAVGAAGAHRRGAADGLEIGYWLRADEQGHGTMTEVVRALSRTLLDLPGITHVEIRHDEANTRSAEVARRCGYRMVRREERPIAAPAESGWGLVWRIGGNPTQEA